MPIFLAALAAGLTFQSGWWQPALPNYRYRFPSDYGAHERSQSEWWYYTGNLSDRRRRRYGFELTVFRFGVQRPLPHRSPWDIDDVYFAHYAISDMAGKRFYYFDRAGRAALGLSGAAVGDENAWVGAWRVRRDRDGFHRLAARAGGTALQLVLKPKKAAVIQGRAGVSRKGPCPNCASHYYSFTRLVGHGTLALGGASAAVSGVAWNDHEWGSDELAPGVVGWDWFSIQLSDDVEIMLYRLRYADGRSVPQSSGTLIEPNGSARYLSLSDFSIAQTRSWLSPHSGGIYPAGWRIRVPAKSIDLTVTPAMADQELLTARSTRANYWEGACDVAGSFAGRRVLGVGYTELTGYATAPPGSRM